MPDLLKRLEEAEGIDWMRLARMAGWDAARS